VVRGKYLHGVLEWGCCEVRGKVHEILVVWLGMVAW